MYYFVREGYTKKDIHNYTKPTEGYANKLTFHSELLEGRVYIDGYFRKDIGMGDMFRVDSKEEYRLKCVRFLI